MSRTAMLLVVAMYAVAVLATPAALPHAIAQWYTKTTNPNKNGLSRFSETFTLPNGHSLIIAMDSAGFVQAFNASTGGTNWSYPLNASNQGELRALYVKGNTVFIASAYNLATVNAVTGRKIAEFSSSVSLTYYSFPLDVDNVYANSDYRVFKIPLATLTPTEIFAASQAVTTMLLLSSNPCKLIVFSLYNCNISVIDATYTVVSSTTSVPWSAAPLLVGTTLLLANTKSSAVEVTAFPDANMTTPTKFIESRGHGHTISKFYSITNASDVTIVAVQYSSRYKYDSYSKAYFSAWKIDGNLTVDDELIATVDDAITTVLFKEAIFVIGGSAKVFTSYNLTSRNATKVNYPLNADATSSYQVGGEALFFVGLSTVYMLCPYTLVWRTQYRNANTITMFAWSDAKGRGKNARSGGLVFGDNDGGVGLLLDSERVNITLSAAMRCRPPSELRLPRTELLIADGVVYVGVCSKLLAYGVTNKKRWESIMYFDPKSGLYNLFYHNGRLFASSGSGVQLYVLVVFTPATTLRRFNCSNRLSFFAFGADVFATCPLYKKLVRITALGEIQETAETTNDIRGVANDDEAAYIIDDSGTLYTAKLASFEKPWTDPNNTKVENVTSAAPTGLSMIKGNLYAGSYPDWRLLGITPASGKRMFELDTEGWADPPFLFNGKLCFTTSSGFLYQMPTGTISVTREALQTMVKSVRVDTTSTLTHLGSPAISGNDTFFFANENGVFCVNAVTMATIWNNTGVTRCGNAYSYMGVAYAKCGDAFYTWDLYTGVRYMQSGTLCNGKIAYMENIVVVADRTQLLSGTAIPMLYAPNELPKLPDGNGDGSAVGSKLWIVGVAAAIIIVIIAVLALVRARLSRKFSGLRGSPLLSRQQAHPADYRESRMINGGEDDNAIPAPDAAAHPTLAPPVTWPPGTTDADATRVVESLFAAGGSFQAKHQVCGFSLRYVEIVRNGILETAFRAHVERLKCLRKGDPKQFHHECQNQEQREVLDIFMTLVHRAPHTLTVYHGCKASVARKIANGGFVDMASTDAGYFGHGIYVTPNAEYACNYATGAFGDATEAHSTDHPDWFAVLLCTAAVGLVYPVTRQTDYQSPSGHSTLFGKPLKAGYDAHFALVHHINNYEAADVPGTAQYGELCVSQYAAFLPLAILWVSPSPCT